MTTYVYRPGCPAPPAGPRAAQAAFVFADLRLTFLRPVYRGRRAGAVSFRLFFLGMGDWLLSGLLAHGRDHLGDRSNGSVEAHGTLLSMRAQGLPLGRGGRDLQGLR